MISWLVAPDDTGSALQQLANLPLGDAFSQERMGFIHQLSQTILTDPIAREFPELMAMAHWFRKAHLLKLEEQFRTQHQLTFRPRGTVFHIAPANVDTLFMYSWLLSLLLGNHNIVRLSQQQNSQLDKLLGYINQLLPDTLRQGNLLLTYPHDDSITAQLSNQCNLRIIWGGDSTVDHIHTILLPEGAEDIGFRDRFSLAALNADTIITDSDGDFANSIAQFYNDAFWFDQRACSSPRLIAWVGDGGAVSKARERFWPALTEYIANKTPLACSSETITRATVMMHWAASGLLPESEQASLEKFPAHLMVNNINDIIRLSHTGTGLFGEITLAALSELIPMLDARDQTLTTYGFADDVLESFKEQAILDRVVPLGQALQFDIVWDGINFFDKLTA